jgi:hypothetical protein
MRKMAKLLSHFDHRLFCVVLFGLALCYIVRWEWPTVHRVLLFVILLHSIKRKKE